MGERGGTGGGAGSEGKGEGRGGEEEGRARVPGGQRILGGGVRSSDPGLAPKGSPALLWDHSSPGSLVALATPSLESPLDHEYLLFFRESPGSLICVGSQSGVSTHQHHLGADMQILGPLQDLLHPTVWGGGF